MAAEKSKDDSHLGMGESSPEPIRPRTHSFDLHVLVQRTRIMKISKLFRSRSDTNVKRSPRSSPTVSPGGSPGTAPRRRFMRVVRDGESSGEEYENPHVIRKYSQQYVENLQGLRKSHSMEEPRTLPYKISGVEHTILKKFSSFDSPSVSASATPDHSPPTSKHASFSGEIEVIEYDKKDKIQKHRFLAHRERISFDEDNDEVGLCSLSEEEEPGLATCPLDERDEYDAGDEAEPERVPPASSQNEQGDIFHFEDDEEHSKKSRPEDIAIARARQLSSDSDSSDCDQRPSRKKKSKLEDLRNTSKTAESTKQAGRKEGQNIEVES